MANVVAKSKEEIKKRNLKIKLNSWKLSLKEFTFSKATGWEPATALKMDPLTYIFRGIY